MTTISITPSARGAQVRFALGGAVIDLARPWTAEELAVVRARYLIDGASVLAAELGRTESAVWRCANRQGVLKNRRWTAEEDERLRMLWGERPLAELARIFARPEGGIYFRAGKLGIRRGAPQGKEFVTTAAERTGFDRATLRKILHWAGVRITKPSRDSKGAWRFGYVDVYDVDRAVEAWLKTEPLNVSARRHGWCAETIRKWLAEAGELPPSRGRKCHLRVDIAVVDRVVAEQMRRREQQLNVSDHARRIGVSASTLSRWLTAAGVERSQFKPWVVDTETVDHVVAERLGRKTCRAKIRSDL